MVAGTLGGGMAEQGASPANWVLPFTPHAGESDRLRTIGALAAGLAHDVNNLLSTVAGHAQLLTRDPAPEVQRRAEAILRAARDGGALLSRLVQHARAAPSPAQPTSLAQAVRDALEVTRPRWTDPTMMNPHQFLVNAELDDATVLADPAELGEVLVNLILNACDAMPMGGTLTVCVERVGANARLTVSDTGSGIAQDVLPRLFEPFFTTKGPAGNGLGLAMASRATREMGGSISVVTSDSGTTFTVELPLCMQPALVRTSSPHGTTRARYPRHVLVIEDDADNRELFAELLEQAGHRVTTAGSGTAGLEAFRQNGADAVVTDLSMDGLDGRAVAAQIKALAPQTPVVLVTGWAGASGGYAVDRVLPKPFEPEVLLRALDEM